MYQQVVRQASLRVTTVLVVSFKRLQMQIMNDWSNMWPVYRRWMTTIRAPAVRSSWLVRMVTITNRW